MHKIVDETELKNPLVIGAAIGAGCYLCYAFAFESPLLPPLVPPGTPRLSHGQEFGMVSVPLSGILGSSVGASWMAASRWWVSAITLAIPVLVAAFVTLLCNSSFTRYGADPSDWLLYVPLLVGSAVCIPLNMALTIAGYIRRDQAMQPNGKH